MRNCVRVPRAAVVAKAVADQADQADLLRAARAAMLLQLHQFHRLHQHLPLLQRPEHAD
jgi:hypothetical protein